MIRSWARKGIGTLTFNPRFTITNAITAALTKIADQFCDLWV